MVTIYKYTNKVNGKAYIGQTTDVSRREWFHRNTDHCPVFSAAIKKYGWEQFEFVVLREGLSYDDANDIEQQLIRDHATQVPTGYNLREGGNNSSPSQETRAKMKAAATSRIVTEDTRRKLSEAGRALRSTPEYREAQRQRRLGIPHTEERKRKISATLKGRQGRKRTDEERQRMSELKLGKARPTASCPHCHSVASTTNIKRWHGDNCKFKGCDPTS